MNESRTFRSVAREWHLDVCPALAIYGATGKILPELLGDIDLVIERQRKFMAQPCIRWERDKDTGKRHERRDPKQRVRSLMALRRYVRAQTRHKEV